MTPLTAPVRRGEAASGAPDRAAQPPRVWRERCLLALALLNHRADDSDVLDQLVRRALLGDTILTLSSEQVGE